MSQKTQLVLMADYNRLMNQRLFAAAKKLSDYSLHEDKGAFFKSVIGTLNHILVGDIFWLKRFSTFPAAYDVLLPLDKIKKPASLDAILFDDVDTLEVQRIKIDDLIFQLSHRLTEADLDQSIEYLNVKGQMFNKKLGDLLLHLFLHQIHHRGQVTTLLSQENIDFGETDLIEIIPDVSVG